VTFMCMGLIFKALWQWQRQTAKKGRATAMGVSFQPGPMSVQGRTA